MKRVQQRILVLAEVRLEIHVDATRLEYLHGSVGQLVRNEYTGRHEAVLQS